jgi:hypothetical protein
MPYKDRSNALKSERKYEASQKGRKARAKRNARLAAISARRKEYQRAWANSPQGKARAAVSRKKYLSSQKGKTYLAKAKVKNREHKLIRLYGITLADFDRMIEEQGGRCLCGDPFGPKSLRPVVDHCH